MQLFLIESAQSSVLTVLHSGLDRDHLWCWLKKGASSAGTQRKALLSFLANFHDCLTLLERKLALQGLLLFMVLNMDGDESCELLSWFYTIVTWLKC